MAVGLGTVGAKALRGVSVAVGAGTVGAKALRGVSIAVGARKAVGKGATVWVGDAVITGAAQPLCTASAITMIRAANKLPSLDVRVIGLNTIA